MNNDYIFRTIIDGLVMILCCVGFILTKAEGFIHFILGWGVGNVTYSMAYLICKWFNKRKKNNVKELLQD